MLELVKLGMRHGQVEVSQSKQFRLLVAAKRPTYLMAESKTPAKF